jgi:insulysin
LLAATVVAAALLGVAAALRAPQEGASSTLAPDASAPAAPAPPQRPEATQPKGDAAPIVKSANDPRNYRRLTLENGLDVLLIEDANATKAAASMDVGVGYWSDPEDIPGLAHFCEHMLFLGTKKYPTEDAYSGFLSSHGGESNAYTSSENTNFFFDVQPEALPAALDRFAQFFIEPLFTESATSREVNAVESEHVKNLQSDSWRTFQLIESLALPSHPFHKFGTGSTETLGRVDKARLRQELIAFWQRYYTANNMRFVLLGSSTLDDMERLVRSTFAQLPRGASAQRAQYVTNDTHALIFPRERLGSFLYSKSVKDERSLTLLWMLPPNTPYYGKKSMDYISSLVGNEGPGSVLSVLKDLGLATGITVGPDTASSQFDLFQIDVDLTSKGLQPESVRVILDVVMGFLARVSAAGPEQWRWEEMGRIAAIHFRVKYKEQSQSYVSTLAGNLHKAAPADILVADFLYQSFDPAHVQALLARLDPRDAIVLLSAQDHGRPLPHRERWYGTEYDLAPIEPALLDHLVAVRNGSAAPSTPEAARLALPPRNEFIPDSLDVPPLPAGDAHPRQYPRLLADTAADVESGAANGSVRVWFKQDDTFRRPRANVVCKLWTPAVYASPRDVVMSSLYTKLVEDGMAETSYAASVVGFEHSFTGEVDGLSLHISGFESHLDSYAQMVAHHLMLARRGDAGSRGFVPSEERFQLVKEALQQEYANFKFGAPHTHASYSLALLLEDPHWHVAQYAAAIREIALADVVTWSRLLLQDVGVECLVHGALLEARALSIVKGLTDSLDFRSVSQTRRAPSAQVQRIVEVDGAYTFYMDAPNPDDDNSAIYAHFQPPQPRVGDVRQAMLAQIAANMLDKPAFHQLRTVEQLGYIVWSGVDQREGVNGLRVIVQSPTRSGPYLQQRVQAFMQSMRAELARASDEEFAVFVNTLVAAKQQKPRTLSEETTRFWSEICLQRYEFARRDAEVAALRNLTRAELLGFFGAMLGDGAAAAGVPSAIYVQVNSQKHRADAGDYGGAVGEYQGAPPQQKPRAQQKPPATYGGAEPEAQAVAPVQLPRNHQHEHASFIELEDAADASRRMLLECRPDGASPEPLCACLSQQQRLDNPAACGGWQRVTKPLVTPRGSLSVPAPAPVPAPAAHEEPHLPQNAPAEPGVTILRPAGATGPSACDCTLVKMSVCDADRSHCCCARFAPKPAPAPAPAPATAPKPAEPPASDCAARGVRREHAPVPLTSSNIAAFKGALCLLPRQPLGSVAPWSAASH